MSRFMAVLRREVKMFTSHKTFWLLSIGLPLLSFMFFVILFNKGVPRDLPIAVLDSDQTTLSRKLARMIDATPTAKIAYNIRDIDEGERMMKEGLIDAIVEIPNNMERDIYSNTQTNVMAYINGLNLTKNGLLNKDIQGVVTTFSSGIELQTLVKKGLSEKEAYDQVLPIYFEKHILFNPYINYAYYLLPSFLPLMLMLFTMLSTIFTIGVELKNGTAAEWFATAGNNPIIATIGKLAPYTVIFFALCMLMNTILFKFIEVPLNGSTIMLFTSGLIYVLTYQAIGLVIITILSNMRLALSIGGGYSVLAFTFSGLTFPFMAMDPLMHTLGYIFPLTYYMEIFIDQAMRGASVVNSISYLVYMSLFLLLPLALLPRLKRISNDAKYWGRL